MSVDSTSTHLFPKDYSRVPVKTGPWIRMYDLSGDADATVALISGAMVGENVAIIAAGHYKVGELRQALMACIPMTMPAPI